MSERQIKLIYYSLEGSESKEVLLPRRRIFSAFFSIFVVLFLLAASSVALFTDYYHNVRLENLKKENELLVSQLENMGSMATVLNKKMRYLEKENEDLRIFADMPALDMDMQEVGIGGAVDNQMAVASTMLPNAVGTQVADIRNLLDQIERRMYLYEDNREEIEKNLLARDEKLKHTPSIRPVKEGRISEKYGYRIDPFTDVQRHHNGIDVAAPTGSQVYASAAGVVVMAKSSYRVGQGYGKEVIIDHGDGVRTRYAHLSKVLVKKGQTVKRWEVVGLVGETGRSTGPHLHYEVMMSGKPVNPFSFIIN